MQQQLEKMIEKCVLSKDCIEKCKICCRYRSVKRDGVKNIRTKCGDQIERVHLGIEQNECNIIPDKSIEKNWEVDDDANQEDEKEVVSVFCTEHDYE